MTVYVYVIDINQSVGLLQNIVKSFKMDITASLEKITFEYSANSKNLRSIKDITIALSKLTQSDEVNSKLNKYCNLIIMYYL